MGFTDRPNDREFPELLAAYADGELDSAGRARVEEWLADNPEARIELENQSRFSRKNGRFWQSMSPSGPEEKSWARLFVRVQDAMRSPIVAVSTELPRRSGRAFGRVVAVVATAACTLLALSIFRSSPDGGMGLPTNEEEAWVVATAADIEIESIHDVDTELLVVGQPPLVGDVVLASAADIKLEKAIPEAGGTMPQMDMANGAGTPMLVVPGASR